MERINGICIDGKFYEVVKDCECCHGCVFAEGNNESLCTPDSMPCTAFQEYCIGFRYSPSLTEMLKGGSHGED